MILPRAEEVAAQDWLDELANYFTQPMSRAEVVFFSIVCVGFIVVFIYLGWRIKKAVESKSEKLL